MDKTEQRLLKKIGEARTIEKSNFFHYKLDQHRQTKKEIIERAKKYDCLIETIDDLFNHLDRLQKCSHCKRDFYDKLCPTCARKLNSQKDGEGN